MLNYQVLSALGIEAWQAHGSRHDGVKALDVPGFITEQAVSKPACLAIIETEKYQPLALPLQKMLTAMLNVLELPYRQLGIIYCKRSDDQINIEDQLKSYLYHYQPKTVLIFYKKDVFPFNCAEDIFVAQVKHPAVLSAYPKEKRTAYQSLLSLKKQLESLNIQV